MRFFCDALNLYVIFTGLFNFYGKMNFHFFPPRGGYPHPPHPPPIPPIRLYAYICKNHDFRKNPKNPPKTPSKLWTPPPPKTTPPPTPTHPLLYIPDASILVDPRTGGFDSSGNLLLCACFFDFLNVKIFS